MCRFNHDCWTSYILLEVPQASKELQVLDRSCHVIKKWHVYLPNSKQLVNSIERKNLALQSLDTFKRFTHCELIVLWNWCWNSPFFSRANERSAVAGSSPAQVFQCFKESETAESEVCLGKFHAYRFIFVYMCVHIYIYIYRYRVLKKRSHSTYDAKSHDIHNWRYLSLNLLFISILFICFTHFDTHLFSVSFSDAKRKRDHAPQAAPPPASTLHCASPPSVARHPCKSHSSTTVTPHPYSKTIPVWSPGYPMYILQDVYTMCSGPVFRKKNWNQKESTTKKCQKEVWTHLVIWKKRDTCKF